MFLVPCLASYRCITKFCFSLAICVIYASSSLKRDFILSGSVRKICQMNQTQEISHFKRFILVFYFWWNKHIKWWGKPNIYPVSSNFVRGISDLHFLPISWSNFKLHQFAFCGSTKTTYEVAVSSVVSACSLVVVAYFYFIHSLLTTFLFILCQLQLSPWGSGLSLRPQFLDYKKNLTCSSLHSQAVWS